MTLERAEETLEGSMISGSDQRTIQGCAQSAEQASGGRALVHKSTQRVLVVDDDQDIRDALCELLRDEGYEAIAVANGEEALTYLKGGNLPCVILLDLMMPVMDGWEFRRQ